MKTMPRYTFTLLLLMNLLISSCTSSKKVVYFQDIEEEVSAIQKSANNPQIQSGDLLTISVSNINPETARPFNSIVTNPSSNQNGVGTLTNSPYKVDELGYINFPVLGRLYIKGMTKSQLTSELVQKLQPYLKTPIVNINIVNYKITILGEVNKPGTYDVEDEKISILEAIGLAGDLTIQGKRDGIMLIREENGQRITQRIDLTSSDVISSEYYYLKQNDVLYVEPNEVRAQNAKYGPFVAVAISVSSIVITLISILFN
ncbi:MAG: sugar transporter [Flavobacteriaceae bacterium]|nr:MAG: sugar transporter [Flavobacteriaceae bacterium]